MFERGYVAAWKERTNDLREMESVNPEKSS